MELENEYTNGLTESDIHSWNVSIIKKISYIKVVLHIPPVKFAPNKC